jgi:hypothetical protein
MAMMGERATVQQVYSCTTLQNSYNNRGIDTALGFSSGTASEGAQMRVARV